MTPVRSTVAQLPEPPTGHDRVHTTPNAVILLDGASAFRPVAVDAGFYAECLGADVAARLVDDPDIDLTGALAGAIGAVRDGLGLVPGDAPSSTVSIARVRVDHVDVLVLGDSPVIVGQTGVVDRVRDDRMAHVATGHRARYRARLADGHGYDEQHRTLLRALQSNQRRARNRPGGYYIAEADPDAARHALVRSYPLREVTWCVLASDGAADPLEHLGLADWSAIARDPSEMPSLLRRCADWETRCDPDGSRMPRAKRHDDKSIAVLSVAAAGSRNTAGRAGEKVRDPCNPPPSPRISTDDSPHRTGGTRCRSTTPPRPFPRPSSWMSTATATPRPR